MTNGHPRLLSQRVPASINWPPTPRRWYVGNTYQELDPKGNTTYKKIEPHTRKTDGFFALIHALTRDSELQDASNELMSLPVYTY